MIKWLKKNWFKVFITLVFIIGLILLDRVCHDSGAQKKIDANNKEISDLKEKNEKLEDEMYEAVENAKAAEKVVSEKEAQIAKSALVIKELREKRIKVVEMMMDLPAPRLVDDLREILACAQIELKDNGVLFSLDCSRKVLTMISQFSLIKEELKETQFSLLTSQEATHFQKMATWYFLGAAWSLGSQVMNYKIIIKKQDENFSLLKKQKKKSFWTGLKIGFIAGVGITVTVIVVIPFVRKIL